VKRKDAIGFVRQGEQVDFESSLERGDLHFYDHDDVPEPDSDREARVAHAAANLVRAAMDLASASRPRPKSPF
jgi:hypothetical protein